MYCIVLYCIVLYCIVLYYNVLCCLFCNAFNFIALHCMEISLHYMHCNAFHCIALHCLEIALHLIYCRYIYVYVLLFRFERIARFRSLEILLLEDNKFSDHVVFAALAGLRRLVA